MFNLDGLFVGNEMNCLRLMLETCPMLLKNNTDVSISSGFCIESIVFDDTTFLSTIRILDSYKISSESETPKF